ncbi:ANTAR domain-containing protein [Mycolicibacter terrae]|uniref:Antitermination regulator n=2 Tax=Mycolicibacter TaxID=1073531 RepID=A0A1A2NTH2_MYCSD|nr:MULTISPECIES: PAS and ANTAR domain-containing protein [Mycolicibacter]OBH18386.1 antitermination regulator [Mycolicibacter sinensis]OBI29390.1 antitermination regulator [Mycolicibacter sinensis]RRR48553.1 ANTAR domain-containing protein [Mycolicibacter terrae]
MVGGLDAQFGAPFGDDAEPQSDLDLVVGQGEPQRVGRFRYWLGEQRWEWSDAVARMHGYEPGTVEPSTELLLQHKHPEDRPQVAEVLERVLQGEPFSSRHRIIDTGGQEHWVIVVGDRMLDDTGVVTGTAGFYVDVTDVLQADVSAVVSEVAESRAVIEQAKGVLMAAYGISAERAFDILVWRSQETNVKVRELAARFLAAMSGTFPPDSVSLVDHTLLTVS